MGKISNEELVNKAMVTADAIATNGKLNPKQANKFIDYVFDLTGLRDKVRTVKFTNETMHIDKIGVGKRVMVPKKEAQDPGVRRGVSTSKISLAPKEVMVPFEIGDNFRRWNIEEEDVEDHVIKMMATQFGNDLEELCLDGDTLGPARFEADLYDQGSASQAVLDTGMELVDGWLKRARSAHLVDLAGANVQPATFNAMLTKLPDKWKRRLNMMRFLSSHNTAQNYRNNLGTRQTVGGDEAISSKGMLAPFGVDLVPITMLNQTPRVTLHVTLPGTTAVALGGFKNVVSGSEIVVPTTIGTGPIAPYVEGTDYNMDYTNGTIARDAGGALTDGQTVKITFQGESQILLTEYMNLICAIGLDITIEKDRDIFKGVNQYAITAKVDSQIEEVDALVWGKNLGLG